jgi:hypothetical protein
MKTPLSTPGALIAPPAPQRDATKYSGALPVFIDMDWYGRVMTSPDAGITHGAIITPNTLSI